MEGKQVELSYINFLLNKYERKQHFKFEECNLFYAINEKGIYVVCDNTTGKCFIEDFKTILAVNLFNNSALIVDLTTLHEVDEQIHQLMLKAESNPVLASRTLDKTLTENRILKEENKRLKEELKGFICDIKKVAGAIINDSNILLKELKKGEEPNVNKK